MSFRRSATALAAALLATAALGGSALASKLVGGAPMYSTRTIVENAVNSKDHTTLVAAVQAAGLVEALQGPGPFTVFAPTDSAFAALPPGTVEALLEPENRETLVEVLTCHVVSADAMAAAINRMIADDGGAHPVRTLGGCTLTARSSGGRILLEDENGRVATVTTADVEQSNGVIHVIDKVLLPQQ